MSASYDYGLSAADVAAELPGIDANNIGVSTEPLSTTDISQWINDGASKLNAVCDRSGITASADMDADAHDALAAAVKAYAVHQALARLGRDGDQLQSARERWNTVYAEYSNRPQQLGDAYTGGYTTTIDSDTKSESWSFINSEGSSW